MALEACERCDGLIPDRRRVCVHCDQVRPARRGAALVAKLVGASAAMMTLMACYGMTRPHDMNMHGDHDHDGDGVAGDRDCDDTGAEVCPGAADPPPPPPVSPPKVIATDPPAPPS